MGDISPEFQDMKTPHFCPFTDLKVQLKLNSSTSPKSEKKVVLESF